ncbi:hypothetical protein AMJ74_00240 [candidate division WOR_3 bacterium SM1_77]|uniref:Uncharacterized protein n=1 Tax=candidate division WOR_3 bacterium SM1_77 TaxID=1703778 RepID=A0A0S8K1U2_UNCW3|nr:MAG: hypothetical protein AMJ74_00240 [candidate division WOR_3 bacterium SM1_77]
MRSSRVELVSANGGIRGLRKVLDSVQKLFGEKGGRAHLYPASYVVFHLKFCGCRMRVLFGEREVGSRGQELGSRKQGVGSR